MTLSGDVCRSCATSFPSIHDRGVVVSCPAAVLGDVSLGGKKVAFS